MLVPNYIFSKLVYTQGEENGQITEEWEVAISQLFTQLQTNFSNEGLVAPSQPSAFPNNFAIIEPVALPGTFLFDETADAINIRLQDGLFHPLQIGGLAVLTIDGTAGDISATRVGQTVTLDLINTTVTPGDYTYPTDIQVDAKGRITSITSGGVGPIESISGTVNQIDVSAGINPVVSLSSTLIMPGTAAFLPPTGTTAQRPGSPTLGQIRVNSDLSYLETWTGAAWQPIDTAGGTVTGVFGTAGQIVVTPSSPNPVVSLDPTYIGQTSITTLGTITTGTWNGTTIAVNHGGTGQTSYTDGQLLIGNTSGNTLTKATLTQGTGVTITNGNGSITISATGTGGTVTSIVAGTALNVGAGPGGTITTTGTLNLANTAVTPASYTNASLTVDQQGRITSASSGTAPVTSVTGTANRITSTGGTTPQIDIAATYVGQTSITTVGGLSTGSLVAGFTPVTVPLGGTGNTTFTAYSVICAGTTATGIFQNVSGVGSSGNILTSNGAAALPTWQAPATSGTVTSITAGTGITLTPSPIVSTGSVAITATGVSASTYSFPINMAVNAQGQITAITSDGSDTQTGSAGNFFIAQAGNGTLSGTKNVGGGYHSLLALSGATGSNNTAWGYNVFPGLTAGNSNTGFGKDIAPALVGAIGSTSDNVLIGNTVGTLAVLLLNTVAVGQNTAVAQTSYSGCTFVGQGADASANTLTNATAIGKGATVGASNCLVLGSGANVGIGISSPTALLHVVGGNVNVDNLTASQAVVTDSSKNLASLAYTSANTASTLVERDGSGNFSAGTITASLTGNATTATTATNTTNIAITDDTSTNATMFPVWVTANTGNLPAKTSSTELTWNPSTALLTSFKYAANSSTQLTYRYLLSGQEFFQASHTSTDGVACLIGVNRSNNRQIWFGDSANLTQNTTNPVVRIGTGASGSNAFIDSISTDGSTGLPMNFMATGALATFGGAISATSYSGAWAGTAIDLAHGGTNAALTANTGGIFYSTASAGAILSGTSTANQVLLSGATAAPAWSTATYPATTTINQLLYSSSASVIAGLATANSAVLITSSGGVPSLGTTLPTGVQTNITSTGTITTGVWNAGAVTSSGTVKGAVVLSAGSMAWSGQTTWDLNITLQAPNSVPLQARCTGWNTYSGAQFKDFVDYSDGAAHLEIVKKLPVKKYYWKRGYYDNADFLIEPGKKIHPHHSSLEHADGKIKEYEVDGRIYHKQIYQKQLHEGFFAQDVYEHFPQIVTIDDKGEPDGLDYSKLTVIHHGALQALAEKIAGLESKIQELYK